MALEVGSALRKITNDTANISAIRGDRMYPMAAPQGATYPLTTYQRVSNVHGASFVGAVGVSTARVQIDHWGTSGQHDTIEDLADKTRLALVGFRGSVAVGSDTLIILGTNLDDDEVTRQNPVDGSASGLTRVRQDFLVSYRETT